MLVWRYLRAHIPILTRFPTAVLNLLDVFAAPCLAHLRRDLPEVQVFQVGARDQAELEVSLEVIYGIPIERQLLQLRRILETPNVIELLYPIVRQEYPLQPRAVLQPVHRLYQVSPQIQLGQRDQPVQVLHRRYQVVRQIQHSQL